MSIYFHQIATLGIDKVLINIYNQINKQERNYLMKIGLLTSLNDNIEKNLAAVKEMGIETCQLKCWNSKFLNDEFAERTKKAAAEYGIEITGFWCGWDGGMNIWDFYEGQLTLGLMPTQFRSERTKMLLLAGEFAKKIGVTDVITHVGFIPENPLCNEYHEIVTTLRAIAKKYKASGLWFLFETGQETPVTLRRVIEDVGTGNLGINLDPANLLMYGKANPVDSLSVFGQYVRNVHAKDGEYPTNGRSLGVEKPLGDGIVNFPLLIAKLKEIGYDGSLTIEREISGEKQIKDIISAKAFLSELI